MAGSRLLLGMLALGCRRPRSDHRLGRGPLRVWLILLAVFIVDASWTLVWRLVSGQPVTQAHSLHAYQRLSRFWRSHVAVDLLLVVINALWLFPLAWAASSYPDYAWILVILAYLPLLAGMVGTRKIA